MATRKAIAVWNGKLADGTGKMNFGEYDMPYTKMSRFEEGPGTNPEELVAAAHAGCYSMFLSALISKEDLTPSIETSATVTLERDDTGPMISKIELVCSCTCEGLSQEKFDELAQAAKEKCPISRLYSGSTATIELSATLS